MIRMQTIKNKLKLKSTKNLKSTSTSKNKMKHKMTLKGGTTPRINNEQNICPPGTFHINRKKLIDLITKVTHVIGELNKLNSNPDMIKPFQEFKNILEIL